MRAVFTLGVAALFAACSSAESRPPAAGTDLDGGNADASRSPEDAGHDAADAAADAAPTGYDAGIGVQCPPSGSMNAPSLNCTHDGTAYYDCGDIVSEVYGALYHCPDENGMPVRPSSGTAVCVAFRRNDASSTTDYICSPETCDVILSSTCEGAGQYAVQCPADVTPKMGCTLTNDAGAEPTYCCSK